MAGLEALASKRSSHSWPGDGMSLAIRDRFGAIIVALARQQFPAPGDAVDTEAFEMGVACWNERTGNSNDPAVEVPVVNGGMQHQEFRGHLELDASRLDHDVRVREES